MGVGHPMTQPGNWSDERRRWTAFYAGRLAAQLERAAALAGDAPAEQLRPRFDSFLSLLNAAAGRPELSSRWLGLVDRLHPLPVRWGQWPAWLAVLRQASHSAADLGRTAQQAEYLAYTADLLLDVGQTETTVEAAQEAMALARRVGAAWPLCVAGAAAAAALRAMVRYDEAQAVIDEIRADLPRMERPQPAARAAMAEALLDLEQMYLLRYYNRLPEAVALGESLVDRLAAVEGVDPHDLATVYLRRATIIWVSGRYGAAADDLKRSAALFRRAGSPLQAIFAEENLGVVYYSMSRYQEAEPLMLAAIHTAEEVNARYRLVSDTADLSAVYIVLGRMNSALDYANRAVALAMEMGNTAELVRGRGNRAYALLGLGRYDEALEDIEFSLDSYQRQGRFEGACVTMIDMIAYLRGTGQEERAAQLARENYEAARREDFPHLHVVTGRCLALFLPPAERRPFLRGVLAQAREYNRPMDEAGCLFSLAAVEPDAGERVRLYEQAVELLHRMGCPGWLDGKSVDDPPVLPMTI